GKKEWFGNVCVVGGAGAGCRLPNGGLAINCGIRFQPSNPELRQVITLRPHWKRTMGGGFQKIETCGPYWASPRPFGVSSGCFTLIRFSSVRAPIWTCTVV